MANKFDDLKSEFKERYNKNKNYKKQTLKENKIKKIKKSDKRSDNSKWRYDNE